jgi:hypothetical protein
MLYECNALAIFRDFFLGSGKLDPDDMRKIMALSRAVGLG